MHWKRKLIVAIFIFALSYYVLLLNGLDDTDNWIQLEQNAVQGVSNLLADRTLPEEAESAELDTNNSTDASFIRPADGSLTAIQKRFEVFGVVTDERRQPIENALISDELVGSGARSDANGQYRIFVEMPKFKNPLLNFLRSGYKGKRISISREEFKSKTPFRLDVSLIETSDSTSLNGWIANDIGAGLADQKIRIVSRSGLGFGTIFYVVFSDDKGEFSFEGIKPDIPYKLEVYPSTGYSGFVIDLLEVTKNTPRLNIVLEPLRLIDLRGMVVNSQGAPVPNFKMLVENISKNFPVRSVSTDSSGFYYLERFPAGEIKFSTLAPEYFKISGITLSEILTQIPVLQVDRGNLYLSGWVSDQNGIPLENARITLDANFRDGDIESYSYRSKHTDNAGTFSFSELGNFSHLITVYAEGFKKQEIRHRFSSPTDNIHITVSPNP